MKFFNIINIIIYCIEANANSNDLGSNDLCANDLGSIDILPSYNYPFFCNNKIIVSSLVLAFIDSMFKYLLQQTKLKKIHVVSNMVSDNFVVFDKSLMKIKFTENESNETISFLIAYFVPLLNYSLKEWLSESKLFTIYGPFIVLLRELARYKRAW